MAQQQTPHRRLRALLSQLAPSATGNAEQSDTHRPFPGCASVLEARACAAAAAAPVVATAAPPVAASLVGPGTRLAGKVVLLTGAGSGIGRACAVLFARQGCKALFLVDRTLDGLEITRQLIAAEGHLNPASLTLHAADVSAPEANEQMVAACVKQFGCIDVFLANAGVLGEGSLGCGAITAEGLRHTLEVNVVAVFLGWQAAAEQMLNAAGEGQSRGVLLATSSVAGLRSGAGGVDYSASKAAVNSMVASMAYELQGTGIRCNSLNPGLVETGMTSPLFEAARARKSEGKVGQLNPLRRAGQTHEIAALALFLASDESSYINGQSIMACGGLSASMPRATFIKPNVRRS